MKLSVLALVVILATVASASDRSDEEAWDSAVQRLRALKQRRGWFFFGGDEDEEGKKKRCDTEKDKALTKSYNTLCKSEFESYTEGAKKASGFLKQMQCKALSMECCSSDKGCIDKEITECCPADVKVAAEEEDED
ncbi:uncharacterized protein LOC144887923 [Branchiostoma floridae x Branchiostoma japonicum]